MICYSTDSQEHEENINPKPEHDNQGYGWIDYLEDVMPFEKEDMDAWDKYLDEESLK